MYNFIVNRTSGGGKSQKIWGEVEQELHRRNTIFAVYFTEYFGHAGELAEMICSQDEDEIYLIVVGGDGSVNEVINGMHHFEKVKFGYIPTGSGNDFGRGLQIKGTATENLNHILDATEVTQMDIGEVWWKNCSKPRHFAISSGVGLDADVCKAALHSRLKKVLNKVGMGSLTYLLLTVKALFSMPTTNAKIIYDGNTTNTFSKMICIVGMNHRYEGGGVPMAPQAVAFDGLLSVCCIYGISRLRAFFLLPLLVIGKHEKLQGFEVHNCMEFELEISRPMALHADGENCGDVKHMKFKCLKGKLNMVY